MTRTFEKVVFRMIRMPCCGHLLCWVNPRFPTYCPECGKSVFALIKQSVIFSSEAVIEIDKDGTPP